MKYLFIAVCFSLLQQHICQSDFNSSRVKTDQEAYGNESSKKYQIMIVPFDYKMYISSIDRDIATKTRLTYHQIRDNMRYGLANQLLLVTKGVYPAISLIESDSSYDDLKYIYNSIGYKYKLAPIKEEEQSGQEKTKIDKLKKSLTKLIAKPEENTNKEYTPARINNGQIETFENTGERYMHTSIHNPNLLSTLQGNYQTNLFIFINELDIEEAKSNESSRFSQANSTRRIKVHFTIIDEKGKDLYGGAATTEMPSYINDMNKIINVYFNKIAKEICAHLPSNLVDKNEAIKQKEDQKKADLQRDQILNH